MATASVSLRHALATIAYRGGKTLRGAPVEFAGFSGCGRTPLSLVAHLAELMEWTLSIVAGTEVWPNRTEGSWEGETQRFYEALRMLDEKLVATEVASALAERLFQGPIADSLTHIGQRAMMRRLAGAPISGENYYVADIAAGRTGPEQAPAVREF